MKILQKKQQQSFSFLTDRDKEMGKSRENKLSLSLLLPKQWSIIQKKFFFTVIINDFKMNTKQYKFLVEVNKRENVKKKGIIN